MTDENAPAGTLQTARNVRYTKAGGIYARRGTIAIPSAAATAGTELGESDGLSFSATCDGAGVLGTIEGEAFAYDPNQMFNVCGRFSTCLPVKRRAGLITERAGSIASEKYGVAMDESGYILVASADGAGFVNVTIESPNGVRLLDNYQIGGTKCLALATDEVFYVVVQNGTALTVHQFARDPGASNSIAYNAASVGTLNAANQFWDISPGTTGTWWLIYQSAAANLRVDMWTALVNTSPAVINVAVTGNCRCSIFFDAGASRVWVGWHNDPGVSGEVRLRAWTSAGVALCAVTTLATNTNYNHPAIGPKAVGITGDAFLTYNRSVAGAFNTPSLEYGYVTLPAVAANPATTSTARAYYLHAISKPDAKQRSWCITKELALIPPSPAVVTERALLMRWFKSPLIGRSFIELSGPVYETDLPSSFPTRDMITHVSSFAGLYLFAVPRQLRLGGLNNALRQLDVYQYEDMAAHQWRSTVQMRNQLAIAGQPAAIYGRAQGVAYVFGPLVGELPATGGAEIGFPVAPRIIATTQINTVSNMVPGTYSYHAVLEWISPSGERHRSPPSDPVTVVLVGPNNAVTLDLSCPNYGQRWDSLIGSYPVIHIYRTEDGGIVHYRITPGSGAPVAFDNVDGVTQHTDVWEDAKLLEWGDALYVDQALCDYNLAPSCRFAWRDERRIWFGGLWETDQVACSLDCIPGQPIEYSDFEGLNGPVYRVLIGEPVTGGAYQDGVNYVFAKRSIYAFSGEGPDRQGNGDFSRPRAITNETGCIDYRSVRATSRGIFFQSERTIEIIPRGGGNPMPVGLAVQDIINAFPLCLGTALHADKSGRFLCFLMSTDAAGTGAVVLEYDLDIGQWGQSTYQDDRNIIGEWPDGTFHGFPLNNLVNSNCGLLEQNDGTERDDGGNAYTSTLITHAMRPWGLAGFGRLNSATLFFSNATGSVAGGDAITAYTIATVDDPSLPSGGGQVVTKVWSSFTGRGTRPDYRELTVAKECTSFRLEHAISGGSTFPIFHGVTLELEQIAGSRRIPAADQ